MVEAENKNAHITETFFFLYSVNKVRVIQQPQLKVQSDVLTLRFNCLKSASIELDEKSF